MQASKPSVLGISFDGLAVSGVVNEFVNVARIFHSAGLRVLLDLGYDITFFPRIERYEALLPSWIELTRVLGEELPRSYTAEICSHAVTIARTAQLSKLTPELTGVVDVLAEKILRRMKENAVAILVVENGTLPDNPLFTAALYKAIDAYASESRLGKFVFWRDHDFMWSVTPHQYGAYPYSGVQKPRRSESIHYVCATEWMRVRVQAWAPGVDYHVIPNTFFPPSTSRRTPHGNLRESYGVPQSATLIARCTRIIPEKTIDRDLYLLAALARRWREEGIRRDLCLFVTGPIDEDPEEFRRLTALAESLGVGDSVVWGNGLLPYTFDQSDQQGEAARFSILDLLLAADISSFLTSYDYEGFGNPPGEAMAAGVPFISTTYELYHSVYGERGAIGPLLEIDANSKPQDAHPPDFLNWVSRVALDSSHRDAIVRHNSEVYRRFFSPRMLADRLRQLFPRLGGT